MALRCRKVLWAGRRDWRSGGCTGVHAARRSHASASSRLVRCTHTYGIVRLVIRHCGRSDLASHAPLSTPQYPDSTALRWCGFSGPPSPQQ